MITEKDCLRLSNPRKEACFPDRVASPLVQRLTNGRIIATNHNSRGGQSASSLFGFNQLSVVIASCPPPSSRRILPPAPSASPIFSFVVWCIIYLLPSSPLLLGPHNFLILHPINLVFCLAETPIPRLILHTDAASTRHQPHLPFLSASALISHRLT
ncbi:uncharacterized protein BJX67DRAFT_97590 [Aspergillus lucknowensis]|uniref:Uncharacterized protein n=1 Tax=Aspergillus lucknowensis TaxID=176173 RepID=A0ABR4M621_9EURO